MFQTNAQYVSHVIAANQKLKSLIDQSRLPIKHEGPQLMGDVNAALRSFFAAMHALGFTEKNLIKRKAVLVFLSSSDSWDDPVRFDSKIVQANTEVKGIDGALLRTEVKDERELRLGRLNVLKYCVLSGLGLLEDPSMEKRMLDELAAGGCTLGLVIA